MYTFSDESGTFVPSESVGSWNVVASLSMPESSHRKLERLLGDFKVQQGFPRNAEIKLKDLEEQDYFQLLERLGALNVALFAVATDMGACSLDALQHHQAMQVQKIREYIPVMKYEGGKVGVARIADQLESLSTQLYVQAVCQTELIHDTLVRAILFFVQRQPTTLQNLRWLVDEKNAVNPSYENTFRIIATELMQAKSIEEPIYFVEGFDYRYLENYRFEPGTMPTHLKQPDGTPVDSGYDLKRMFKESLRFVDSRMYVGVQAADLLAAGLRRLLRDGFSNPDKAASLLGRLMITNKKGSRAIALISMDRGSTLQDERVARSVKIIDSSAKWILKSAA